MYDLYTILISSVVTFNDFAPLSNSGRRTMCGLEHRTIDSNTVLVVYIIFSNYLVITSFQGVAHLARTMVMKLKNDQPELDITDREVTCVELAGLCHDLGHGPWSHVWDAHFIPEALLVSFLFTLLHSLTPD